MRQITPIDNHGSIQLRFTVAGIRYSFNPLPGARYSNRTDLRQVQAIATQIENDIRARNFDQTLDRYRLYPVSINTQPSASTVLGCFDIWVDTLGLSESTYMNKQYSLRVQLQKVDPAWTDTTWILRSGLAPSTIQQRTRWMRQMYAWCLQNGHRTGDNPWIGVRIPKQVRKPVKPFTVAEMERLLEAFRDRSPHYLPMVTFLLLTGCRISEAIGLRWQHVDLCCGTLTISESLSLDRCANGYRRVRKQTKTGDVRVLPMSETLLNLLAGLKPGQPDSPVFTSVRGHTIHTRTFRQRHWKPCLEAAQVPYRCVHTTRHTLASHAIAGGMTLPEVAYLLGHTNTVMVMRTYGHLVDQPTLPDIGIQCPY